jgi:hypothetical protein
MSNFITIGIDPGRVTGAAVYNSKNPRLMQLASLGGKECHGVYLVLEWFKQIDHTIEVLSSVNDITKPSVNVVIEDTRFMTIYEKRRNKSKMVVARVARSVGQIDLAIDLITIAAKKLGFKVTHLKPMQGTTKLNAHEWQRKYQIDEVIGRINQHQRDAYPYAMRGALENGKIPLIRTVKSVPHYSQINFN